LVGSRIRQTAGVTPLEQRIAEVVAGLQVGEVVSYSEVARRAGNRRWARVVGAFLAEHGDGLPWWRVVRADGSLVAPSRAEQARRLRAEHVEVSGGRVVDPVP
jgi:methylated-DNA-protein-cysteine methyltransferase related protein